MKTYIIGRNSYKDYDNQKVLSKKKSCIILQRDRWDEIPNAVIEIKLNEGEKVTLYTIIRNVEEYYNENMPIEELQEIVDSGQLYFEEYALEPIEERKKIQIFSMLDIKLWDR